MRILFVLMSLGALFVSKTSNELYKKVDEEIYEMYINNFEDYLYLDENYILNIDTKKLKDDMSNELYEIIVYDSCNLHFKVRFKYFILYEKEYYFYLERQNEKS